jgi:NAD(P)-dependent dehydrogenase (short-subunit alcohol dehydrogenase family)
MSSEHTETSQGKSFLDKFHIPGKVALIAGGSRGIGHSIALGLAEAGADVVLAARKIPDLEKTAQEITDMGRKALPVQCNIRHLPEVNNLVKTAVDRFHRIDILVNNAAANPVFGSVFEIDERVWDIILGVNLKAYFFLSQAVGKVMREKGGGSIINVSSIDGIEPLVGLGVYSISKAGVNMLTRVLAQEWGQYNIRVNTLIPGPVRTSFSELFWENPLFLKTTEDNIALGRRAEPEEMVNAVLFLTSEASSYMTGQSIVLDGGHFGSLKTWLSAIAKNK